VCTLYNSSRGDEKLFFLSQFLRACCACVLQTNRPTKQHLSVCVFVFACNNSTLLVPSLPDFVSCVFQVCACCLCRLSPLPWFFWFCVSHVSAMSHAIPLFGSHPLLSTTNKQTQKGGSRRPKHRSISGLRCRCAARILFCVSWRLDSIRFLFVFDRNERRRRYRCVLCVPCLSLLCVRGVVVRATRQPKQKQQHGATSLEGRRRGTVLVRHATIEWYLEGFVNERATRIAVRCDDNSFEWHGGHDGISRTRKKPNENRTECNRERTIGPTTNC